MPSSCLNLEEKTSKIWGNLIQLLPIQNSQSLTVSRNYCKKEKNEGFLIANISNGQHCISTNIPSQKRPIFARKIVFGLCKRFVITSLWNTWPLMLICAIFGHKLMFIHSISIWEWDPRRFEVLMSKNNRYIAAEPRSHLS